jgi:hypothetical protein
MRRKTQSGLFKKKRQRSHYHGNNPDQSRELTCWSDPDERSRERRRKRPRVRSSSGRVDPRDSPHSPRSSPVVHTSHVKVRVNAKEHVL